MVDVHRESTTFAVIILCVNGLYMQNQKSISNKNINT